MRDIDPRYEAYWYEAYGRVVRTGEPVRAEHYAEPHGRWFDFQLSRIGGPGSRLVASLFQDITERKRSEAALRESEARLARELEDAQRLQRISSILIQRDDGAIFEELIDAAQALMQADCASLQVMDRNKGELELLAWRGFHPESAAHWQRVAVGSGTSCAAALAHGERLLIEDVAGWAHADAATLAHWRLSGIRAVQSTPLVARDGQIVGMLSTHWRHPHRPGERDLGVFGVLARQVADVLERRRAARAA
jgi:PAS domain-containing protein